MRCVAKISYDGYDFLGFQKQNGARTIQGEIEGILSQIFNCPIAIFVSGRTDRQVHALGQYFHFDIDKEIDVNRLCHSVNRMITSEIHLYYIKEVPQDFHARFSSKAKEYHYYIATGENNPFLRRYKHFIKTDLDIALMREVGKIFLGTHDFKCFTSKPEDEQNYMRTIYDFEIVQNNKEVVLKIRGDGFMRYMVRMIFGVLVAIGQHKEDPNLAKSLLMSQNREVTRHKLPGHGLYLVDVKYEESER